MSDLKFIDPNKEVIDLFARLNKRWQTISVGEAERQVRNILNEHQAVDVQSRYDNQQLIILYHYANNGTTYEGVVQFSDYCPPPPGKRVRN